MLTYLRKNTCRKTPGDVSDMMPAFPFKLIVLEALMTADLVCTRMHSATTIIIQNE